MAPRRVQGFSLIELMVVATIIGLSIVVFTPSFIFAMADRRAAAAVSEVVRLGRRGRAEAIGTQRAHLVWIRPDVAIVQLLRGGTARCDVEAWNAVAATCPVDGTDQRQCLENVDFGNARWFRTPFQIRLRSVAVNANLRNVLEAPPGPNTFALCYEPSGTTFWASPAVATGLNAPTFSSLNQGAALGGAFLFAVGLYHLGDSSLVGTPRMLAFPLGATPRRLR